MFDFTDVGVDESPFEGMESPRRTPGASVGADFAPRGFLGWVLSRTAGALDGDDLLPDLGDLLMSPPPVFGDTFISYLDISSETMYGRRVHGGAAPAVGQVRTPDRCRWDQHTP